MHGLNAITPWALQRCTYHLFSVFSTRPSGQKKDIPVFCVVLFLLPLLLSLFPEHCFYPPEGCDSEEYFIYA